MFGAVACCIVKAIADRILCSKCSLPRRQIWNSLLQMRIAQKTDFVPSLEVRYSLEQFSKLLDALPAVSGIDSG